MPDDRKIGPASGFRKRHGLARARLERLRDEFGPVFTWVGVVGTAVTVFGNLQAVLDMADWARWLVVHWTGWSRAFWGWTLGLIGWRVPDPFVPFLTAAVFISMTALDSASRKPPRVDPPAIAVSGGIGATLCLGILLVPAIHDLMLPEITDRDILDLKQFMERVDRDSTLALMALIGVGSVLFLMYGILRACGFWVGFFSWRPAIVGLTVLLLLGLNELSKLDIAPLMKAPPCGALASKV